MTGPTHQRQQVDAFVPAVPIATSAIACVIFQLIEACGLLTAGDLLLSFEMKLPHGESAIVDLAKLRDYCLNPAHPRGRHKARVFASTLGLRPADAGFLREELLRAAREGSATPGGGDEYGERYTVDFELTRGDRQATVRSTWIIRGSDSVPRLTSCFILLK